MNYKINHVVVKMPNRYSALVCWAVMTAMSAMVAISCSFSAGVENTDPMPTIKPLPNPTGIPTTVVDPSGTPTRADALFGWAQYETKPSHIPTATPFPIPVPTSILESKTPFTFTTSYYATPTPSGNYLQDLFAQSKSYPTVDSGIVPTPFPITKEWVESGINSTVGRIAYENEIFLPDYTTFPLDIPGSTVILKECSSAYIIRDMITTFCIGDNKDDADVYMTVFIIIKVNIWDGDGKGAIVFSVVGEPLDWASIQMCSVSFYKYPANMLSSLSCEEPDITSVDTYNIVLKRIVDFWRGQ